MRTSHAPSGPATSVHRRHRRRDPSLKNYAPLAILVGLAVLSAGAKQIDYSIPWSGREWMLDAMGFFLVTFSMFKLFDLPGFADGFHRYDLLAKRWRGYGFVYPFVELGLGLGYLARWHLPVIYSVTVVVMTFGALGVIRALRQRLDLDCACMGTVLKVPLSTVALTEDLTMAAMAAAMLMI
jgi:hypothetical protein